MPRQPKPYFRKFTIATPPALSVELWKASQLVRCSNCRRQGKPSRDFSDNFSDTACRCRHKSSRPGRIRTADQGIMSQDADPVSCL